MLGTFCFTYEGNKYYDASKLAIVYNQNLLYQLIA